MKFKKLVYISVLRLPLPLHDPSLRRLWTGQDVWLDVKTGRCCLMTSGMFLFIFEDIAE